MTKADIAFQVTEYLNRIWDMQQWWASISIGVLIMAHLASSRLNLLLLLMSLGLYTSYTLYMTQMLGENYETILALIADLELLVASQAAPSHASRELLAMRDTCPLAYYVTFGGTFLCVVAYLLYSYVVTHHKRRD